MARWIGKRASTDRREMGREVPRNATFWRELRAVRREEGEFRPVFYVWYALSWASTTLITMVRFRANRWIAVGAEN